MCKFLQPPRCDNEIYVTTDLKEEVKHIIEDELQTDQLLYTTAGPLATSNTVRIVQTTPADTISPPSSPSSINTDRVSIEVTDKSSGKSSLIITNKIQKQNKFLLPHKQQGSRNVEFKNEIEGYLFLTYYFVKFLDLFFSLFCFAFSVNNQIK